MAADDLAPSVVRSSTAMVLHMEVKQVIVIHKWKFEVPAPYEYWEIIENANIYISCFLKYIQHSKCQDP